MTLFLAQVVDPVSGGAGWVGAGLLGAVLAWLLLKHLPDKDKQIQTMVEGKDLQIKTLMEVKDKQITDMLAVKNEQLKVQLSSHDLQLKTLLSTQEGLINRLHQENKDQLEKIIKHCKDEQSLTGELLQKDLNNLGEAIDDLGETMKALLDKMDGHPRPGKRPRPGDPPFDTTRT